jgi:S-layer protein (TIGR01567 family)
MNKRTIVLIALVAVASLMPASAETLEVRGDVVNLAGTSNSALVWDAYNFAAFWYDMDDDLQTETLTLKAGVLNGATCDRTVEEDALTYTTYAIYQEYELHENEGLTVESDNPGGDTGYWLEGWVGEKYVAIDNNADKLSKLLVEFEDDDKKMLSTNEEWDLGGGFSLTANHINLSSGKVWFTLKKDDKELDSEVIATNGTRQDCVYTYTADIGNEEEIPVFSCYVDAVFRGPDSNFVQVMYVFLIDDDVLEIDTSDKYGIMEVMTASKTGVVLRNNDATLDLDTDTKEQIMGNIYFRTADDDCAIRFYPMVEYTEPGTYEVRGGVVDLIGTSNPELAWNALDFGAFWYDLDDDLQTERLALMAGVLNEATDDRTIDEDALIYTTHAVYQEYELHENENITVESDNDDGDTGYWIEGWMGEKYAAIDNNSDKLCKLLLEFEDDDTKILFTGEKWDLGGGFVLELLGIDDEGHKVTLQLFKNDTPLEGSLKCIATDCTNQKRVYTYTADIGGEKKIPVFSCYVDAVFKGDVSYAQLMYAFLIDDDVLWIKTSDMYGAMEVRTASKSGVTLRNNDEVIDLNPGTTQNITDTMYFKIADDDTAIRFYPFVERTIGGEEPTPPATIPATDSDHDGVPDVWDADNSTPLDYWVNSDGIGRKWGDMNGDGELTSADALMILQAAVGKIELG